MINYTAGSIPPNPCFEAPQSGDLSSVWCNVYALCAGVRVAAGDVDNDGCDEIITAPGPGQRPFVRVWDALIGNCITPSSGVYARWTFLAYDEAFLGGMYVAAGNVDSANAWDEVVTGPGQGGGPNVKVWKFTGQTVANTYSWGAYGGGFTGGIRVATGNLNCSSPDEILVSPGPGGTQVKTYLTNGTEYSTGFVPYSGFTGGIYVGGGNMSSTYCGDEIATGPEQGGGPDTRAFCCSSGGQIANFWAYDPGFAGGVRVGAGNYGGDATWEIVTGAGPGGGAHVRVFEMAGYYIQSFFALDSYPGGVFVAGGNVNGSGNFEVVTGLGPNLPLVRVWSGQVLQTEFWAWQPPIP